jgi:hypothetical protein
VLPGPTRSAPHRAASPPHPAADDRAPSHPGPHISRTVPRRPDPTFLHCHAATPPPAPTGRGPLPATELFPHRARAALALPRSASTRRPTPPTHPPLPPRRPPLKRELCRCLLSFLFTALRSPLSTPTPHLQLPSPLPVHHPAAHQSPFSLTPATAPAPTLRQPGTPSELADSILPPASPTMPPPRLDRAARPGPSRFVGRPRVAGRRAAAAVHFCPRAAGRGPV